MRTFAFSTLVGGLFLLVGLAACGTYPVHLIPKCYDDDGHRVQCCGEWPDMYPCSANAGVDGDVEGDIDGGTSDASDDGEADASDDDGGPPGAVCPSRRPNFSR